MPSSRAIVVLGMHRNGTSLLTRGLQALDVYLGKDFYAALPDNPTGYWEDRVIQNLNDRILNTFGLKWDSIGQITDEQWRETDLEAFRQEALQHLRVNFLNNSLWGFKDPRTILLLRFWHPLFRALEVDDRYLVAVRNPLSVAGSLRRRQNMPGEDSHLLWLLHMVPPLHQVAARPFVVLDYDHLMDDPIAQLTRIANKLEIPFADKQLRAATDFARDFVQPGLRHHHFLPDDFAALPRLAPASREAYLLLARLAADQLAADSQQFLGAWERLIRTTMELVDRQVVVRNREAESQRSRRDIAAQFIFTKRSNFPDLRLFVVSGTQRTGTNLLRELLNTNSDIAMMSEILTPCVPPGFQVPGPPYPDQPQEEAALSYQIEGTVPATNFSPGLNHAGFWGNFLRTLPRGSFPAETCAEAEAMLDRYFEFLRKLIRDQWVGDDKRNIKAIGVDIKYSHLHRLAPRQWDAALPPFLLNYLRAREVPIIHGVRRNVIQCAISAFAVNRMGICHNYGDHLLDRQFVIEPLELLALVRWIVRERDKFFRQTVGMATIEYEYEDLVGELALAHAITGEIPPNDGPLLRIAATIGVTPAFGDRGALKKLINIPYSRLLLNYCEIVQAVEESEFSEFGCTLT